jgi:hypothetical protein
METKLNIYQKLLKIQQKINGLGKDKKSFTYSYVTGDKVLGEIKPLMNEMGLILKQEVLSIDNERQDYATAKGNKSEILSKVMMRFTWIDTETGEKDENLFGANGQNDWEKGLGSALTYAERYFLLKFFHIATDEDDIDNDKRKTSEPIKIIEKEKAEPSPQKKPAMNEKQLERVLERIGKGEADAYQAALNAFEVTEDQAKQLKESFDFQQLTK